MSPKDVGTWMADRLRVEGVLYQDEAAAEIIGRFGEVFTYPNANGNVSIRKDVLAEFRKLTEGTAVWQRGERAWRVREPYDVEGRLG